MMISYRFILAFCSLILLCNAATAQTSDQQPSRFDLVIFGSNLDANSTRVWLKENPGINNNWQQLPSGNAASHSAGSFSILVFSGLSTEKFAGQDIRENYIALKVTSNGDAELRAVYALPSSTYTPNALGKRLHSLIQSHPVELQKYSIASQLRPRPVALSQNSPFVEHIEMPVRHLKAGVQEVKWLDVIFSRE